MIGWLRDRGPTHGRLRWGQRRIWSSVLGSNSRRGVRSGQSHAVCPLRTRPQAFRLLVGVPICVAGRAGSSIRCSAGRVSSLRVPLYIRSANYSCGTVILRGMSVDGVACLGAICRVRCAIAPGIADSLGGGASISGGHGTRWNGDKAAVRSIFRGGSRA